MIKYFDDVQVITGIWDNKIAVLNYQNSQIDDFKPLADLILFSKICNINFENTDILFKLNEENLKEIENDIARKNGITLFDIDSDYGVKELLITLAQYLHDYGNFDFDESIWMPLNDIEVERNYEPKTIKFVDVKEFETEVNRIVKSSKNPDSFDNSVLFKLCDIAESADFEIIPNKTIVETLLRNGFNFTFKPINAAQLRIYGINFKKLKTSQKTFIMRTLSKMDESDVLDDFATEKGIWQVIESRIIPTQKRFSKYKAARYFERLRDSDFSDSNNSKTEKMFKTSADSSTKFNELCVLKSPQFAIRNLSRIVNENTNYEELENAIAEKNIKLKQLIEAYNGLSISSNEKTAKIKGVFYTRSSKSGNEKTAKNEKLLNVLRNSIAKSIRSIQPKYASVLAFDSDIRKKFDEMPDIKVSVDDLRGLTLPLNTDNFMNFEKNPLINRGSEIPLPQYEKGLAVFVSWKRKDNQKCHQDIDLSCNIINSDFQNDILNTKSAGYVGFANLLYKDGYIKHSGDFTSCMEYNPKTGFITTEMIAFNPKDFVNKDLHFIINTFNGISMKDFDVYIGICEESKITKVNARESRCKFKLEDAIIFGKITGDINGYYKLFTISNDKIIFEGCNVKSGSYRAADSASKQCVQSLVYTKYLSNFDIKEFVNIMYPDKTEVNPYKLKMFLDYAINTND